MKYYTFRPQDNADLKTKKLKTGRIIKLLLVVVLIAIVVALFVQYRNNEDFREFVDVKILRKEISNENTVQIDISSKTSPFVYTYSRYITILDKNVLEVYTGSSKPDFSLDISVSTPIFADSNRFLCIAEKGGNKVYLVSGPNIIWQKDVEGQISKVNLNRNGYVAVVTSNYNYNTTITLYNPNGEELFKTYLKTSYAADVEISNDNKYLAIVEVDASGTSIQSDVKLVSVESAKFVKTFSDENKSVITNLKYQDRAKLICMYNDRIVSMTDAGVTEIQAISSNTAFADIELTNCVLNVEKQVSGILKTDYYAIMTDLTSFDKTSYKLNGVPKSVYCSGDIIAVNYGTEVEIFNTGGWLVRRYRSLLQEIRDISLSSSALAILYKDKVEIVNL